ncbi:MAG: hypothetical protein GY804_09855 [Alphaproteobacteria bacterium]|nr:hypothetical protein [Alphaproteobacteria bacterium]
MPNIPVSIRNMTNGDIQTAGNSIDIEDVYLRSKGLKDHQVITVKNTTRWKHNWGIGKARFEMEQNENFVNSKEPSIQKIVAERTLPQIVEIDEDTVWEIDAPKYFRTIIGTKLKVPGRRGKKVKT